jgi:NAD(P)-dependent dehydrogenase (short-subunit alcohol dehydrogenase family)
MELNNRVAVITGGAQGIGLALARHFAAEGARVVVADLDADRAAAAAAQIDGMGLRCDVTSQAQIQALVEATIERFGRVDLFCSNAGVLIQDADNFAHGPDDAGWALSWNINVMAHVYAARAVLPHMLARGEGYLLNMVSAAGMLHQVGAAAYSATKHAALALAESLAIGLSGRGIKVSAICPAYVATSLIGLDGSGTAPSGVISVEEVAETVLQGVREERFMILPHPEVAGFAQHKAADPESWIKVMGRMHEGMVKQDGSIDWAALFSATAPRK